MTLIPRYYLLCVCSLYMNLKSDYVLRVTDTSEWKMSEKKALNFNKQKTELKTDLVLVFKSIWN